MDVEHDPVADVARGQADLGDLVPADAVDIADHHQRAADGIHARVLDERPHAESLHARQQRVADRVDAVRVLRADPVARPDGVREVELLNAHAGHAAVGEVDGAVVDREDHREQRGLLGGACPQASRFR